MNEVNKKYYESLLQQGIKLNSCVMVHNAYWSYFTGLNSHYRDVNIHTFGGELFYLHSKVRKYPNEYSYTMYDMFLLASNSYFDNYSLEELEQLAEKMSENKRITLGYSYPVAHQGSCSYIIESYFNGIKDFSDTGVLEKLVIASIQMIDNMAKKHMELMREHNQEQDGNNSLELKLPNK